MPSLDNEPVETTNEKKTAIKRTALALAKQAAVTAVVLIGTQVVVKVATKALSKNETEE